jgi:hypothetical protein
VRSAPREEPASVRDTITRYNKTQARRFTDQAAKTEEQYVSANLPTIEVAEAPADEPTPEMASRFVTPSDPPVQEEAPVRSKYKHSPASRKLTEWLDGKPDTAHPRHTETALQFTDGSEQPIRDSAPDRPKRGSNYQQRKFEELRPDTPHGTALSHEHTPRSTERPGRLIYDRTSAAPKEAPRRQPTSQDAAKYTPSGEAKPDNPAAPVTAATPATTDVHEASTDGEVKPTPDRGSERGRAEKPGKLRFDEGEADPSKDGTVDKKPGARPPAGRKLEKAQHKAERSANKLEKARDNLPKKMPRPKIERTFDEASNKSKRKLVFEREVKSQSAHMKGPLVTRPVKAGANSAIRFAHTKVFQVEHENVGTQAAHRGEMLAEGGLRTVYRLHKTAPYRKVEKLTRRTTKLNIKASYQQALHDNPKLKSNIFSRMAQKRKIKRQYAKAAREAQKAGKRAKKAGDVIGRAGQAVVRFVARHPVIFAIIGVILLLVVIISGLFTSCSNMGSGVGGAIVASSYLAQDADVDNAELAYTEWETAVDQYDRAPSPSTKAAAISARQVLDAALARSAL